ncbi:MAG: RodZ domain-containing protein [Deltaproteobacteria bacterium]
MESPGEYLRRERELRRVSLTKIFEVTRVPVKALEALEADNYENLPHPTFVKGYIKSYCKALGLDENDAVLRYEIYLRENAPDKPEAHKVKGALHRKLVIPDDERLSFLRLSRSARTYLIYGAVGIVLILAGYLFFSGDPDTVAPEPQAALEQSAPPAPALQSSEPPQTEAGTASTEVKVSVDDASVPPSGQAGLSAGRHTLSVTAREVAWIKIRIDGKEATEVILKAGESFSWDAAETFSLLVGNAGGIDMVYDGAKLPPLGKSGESVSIRLPRAKASQAGEGPKPADVKGANGAGAGKKPQPGLTEPAGTNRQ